MKTIAILMFVRSKCTYRLALCAAGARALHECVYPDGEVAAFIVVRALAFVLGFNRTASVVEHYKTWLTNCFEGNSTFKAKPLINI